MGTNTKIPIDAGRPVSPVTLQADDLLSLVGDGVVCTDEDGRIILFNKAAEEMFGLTAAVALNQSIELLLPDRSTAYHQNFSERYAHLASNDRTTGDKRAVVGRRSDGTEFPVEATLCRRLVGEETVLTMAIRDVTERRGLEDQRHLVGLELRHRMKNVIAVVCAVVSLTAKASASVPEFHEGILGRLLAIERSNDLLFFEQIARAELSELVEAELAAYIGGGVDRVVVDGPPVLIGSGLIIPLSLIVHELATNAAKYGAFATPGGRVAMTWSVCNRDGEDWLVLNWCETGCSNITAPTKRGFGSELIERSLCKVVRGRIQAQYLTSGLNWRMNLPLLQ